MTYGPPAPSGAHGTSGPERRPWWPSIHPLDAAVVAAGAVIVIFSFFDYYTYEPKGRLRTACAQPGAPKIVRELCNGANQGAWSGLFGWLAVVVAAIGAGAVAVAACAPQVRLPGPGRLIAVGAFALGVLGTLLALFFVPNYTVDGVVAHGSHYGKFVTEGHGFSYWLIIALQLVGLVGAFVRYQQTGSGVDRFSGAGSAIPSATPPARPSPFPSGRPSPHAAPPPASPYAPPRNSPVPPGPWSPPPPA